MFFFKRRKIESWLQTAAPSPFAELLSDWHSGAMAEKLARLGLGKAEFHIDWLNDYRCINIQGRRNRDYVDIQIEKTEFSLAVDPDEPDEPENFPLVSCEAFYETVRSFLE